MSFSSIFQRNDETVSQTTVPSTSSNSQVDTVDVVTDQPITGLLIPSGYSGFRILLTVNIDATTDRSETFDLLGTYDGTTWSMSQNSVQNANSTNIIFTIDSIGQIKYTSTPAIPGFVKRTLQWVKQVL